MVRGATPARNGTAHVKLVNRHYDLFMRMFVAPLLLWYFRVHAIHRANLPVRGPAILVANHVNLFDPIWVYGMAHRSVHFAATEDLFRNRLLAVLVRSFGPLSTSSTSFTVIPSPFRSMPSPALE